MRRHTRILARLGLAAALLGACAGDERTTVSAQSSGTAAANVGGGETPMPRPAAVDLAWLDRVVEMLQTSTTTRDTLAAFFGVTPADASPDGWSVTGRYGLARVRIYDLAHVAIDIAVEAVFRDGSRPRLAELEARLGRSRTMQRRPDDFSSGRQVAFYPQSGRSRAFVRVFAELAKDDSTVTTLQMDRAILTAAPGG
jgi:hypothetical protein